MSDSDNAAAKSRSAFGHAYGEFADAGILMSLVAALSNGGYAIATGAAPHWAAVAGTAICAAYFTLPGVRSLGRGMPAPDLPREVLAAASDCAFRASQDGDDGIWAVHDRDRGTTRFMTVGEFVEFRAALPRGTSLALVDAGPTAMHVRRYVDGVLDSSDDHAAHCIFGQDGTLTRAVDYRSGNYTGERDLKGAGLIPAP